MRVLLLLSGVACLAFMALHAWRENLGAEWISHQERYAETLAARATTETERAAAAAFEVKLRQAVLPEGYATDRCISCHVAIEDPKMTQEQEPLRTHPGEYLNTHPIERFGCTLCHDGQGLAVNVADAAAYSRDRYWEKPLLKAPFREANCYRCHNEVLPETPTYAFGKQIFEGSGCTGCHKVRGRGGNVGPDLSLVGDLSRHLKAPTPAHHDLVERFDGNESIAYLYESVRWPNAQPAVTKMPEFGFSDEEAIALVVYLKSFVRPATVVGLLPPPREDKPLNDPVERGRVTYAKYCIGCHGAGAAGGVTNENAKNPVVPALNGLAHRMAFTSADDVDALLRILRALNGAQLAESDAAKLANWTQIQRAIAETRRVIAQGLAVTAVDANGPEPLDMPSWQHLIDEKEIDALIAYLISTAPRDEQAAAGSGKP